MKFIKILTIFICLLISLPILTARDFVLVIDPGHGGKDVGARGVKAYEKNITLAVAKLFGDKVTKEMKDVKVVYTRDKDTYVKLNDRAQIANDAHGDLFVSIHVNSVAKKNRKRRSIAGAEVYTLGLHRSDDNLAVAMRENSVMSLEADNAETYQGFDPESSESYIIFELSQSKHMDQSIEMAELVQRELVSKAGRSDKGVRQAGFWVLWATSMPSILIELDFICNPTQEKFLNSTDGQRRLADAIFEGFKAYKESNPVADLPDND
ncbi:MAG: N-acetylmuramoyl-L-alanine amidase [Clostridiales bacterium]|nr:N-acetylmuramoyl-L-alanine amidase [Clostridiales bacterium]